MCIYGERVSVELNNKVDKTKSDRISTGDGERILYQYIESNGIKKHLPSQADLLRTGALDGKCQRKPCHGEK